MSIRKTVSLLVVALLVSGLAIVDDAYAKKKKETKTKVFDPRELCDRQYASGVEFKKNSRLIDAKDAFVTVIEACPDYRKAYVQLGNIELNLKNFPGAIENYEKALELDGTDMEAKEALGFAYQQSGRGEEAVDLFLGVLEDQPDRLSTVQYLAVAYEQEGKKPEAFMLYEKAYQSDQQIVGLEEKLTNLALELKQYEEAYAFTRRQVDRDSTNVDLKRKLAYFHLKAEDWEHAVDLYQKLVDQHGDDPGTLGDRELLAYSLNKAGRTKEAFPIYDYILEHTESPTENMYYFYGSALVDDGQYDRAISVCNKGLQINSGWGCVAYVRAESMSKKGEAKQKAKSWDAAKASFEQARTWFGNIPSGSNCAGNAPAQVERQSQLIDRLGKIRAKEEG